MARHLSRLVDVVAPFILPVFDTRSTGHIDICSGHVSSAHGPADQEPDTSALPSCSRRHYARRVHLIKRGQNCCAIEAQGTLMFPGSSARASAPQFVCHSYMRTVTATTYLLPATKRKVAYKHSSRGSSPRRKRAIVSTSAASA